MRYLSLLVSSGLALWALVAAAQPLPAMRHLRTHGTIDLSSEVITCTQNHPVGLRLEDDGEAVHLSAATVAMQDCAIGLLVQARGDVAMRLSGVTVKALPRAQSLLQPLAINGYQVGFWLQGRGGVVNHNIIGGVTDGIVLTGSGWRVINNELTDNQRDGLVLTGHENLIQENTVRRNGQVGIHATEIRVRQSQARSLPFPELPVGNLIQLNTVLENGQFDLADFHVDCSADPLERRNTWQTNTFEHANGSCFH